MKHYTRRESLLTLGTGLATSLAWPVTVRAADAFAAFSFLVVSDTHVGRGDNDAAARQWARTARELDQAEGDFVLHLGDIVDGGREAQYAVYKETRRVLRKPIHEIPGNHDPQALFEKHIRRQADTSFDHKRVRFVLVNNSRADSHDGFLTARQIGWLGDQCGEAAKRGLYLILSMHVPAHDNRHPDRGWHVKAKDGQTELYALLAQHRDRVLALFHGHFHNGVRGWDDHVPYHEIAFPSSLYNQNRNLAEQKAPGYYLAELRPGFVKVTLRAGRMDLAYKPMDVEQSATRQCPLAQLKG